MEKKALDALSQSKCYKFGFTLAEVLITLGIIGVVAALTLPSILATKQRKELEVAFKKEYSVMQNVLLDMSRRAGQSIGPTTYNVSDFAKEFAKSFDWYNLCNDGGCINGEATYAHIPNHTYKTFNTYKTYDYSKNVTTPIFNGEQILLKNGVLYMIGTDLAYPNAIFITVDVNGMKKKPNAWGRDLFTFVLWRNGKLTPVGAPETWDIVSTHNDFANQGMLPNNHDCSPTPTTSHNGLSCAYWALTDPDFWKK